MRLFVLISVLLLSSCGGGANDVPKNGTTEVNIVVGSGVASGALLGAGNLPVNVAELRLNIHAASGKLLYRTQTTSAPNFPLRVILPNAKNVVFDLVALDAAGRSLYHGQTIYTMAGGKVALRIKMNLFVDITATNGAVTIPRNGTLNLTAVVGGLTPAATSPLFWGVSGGSLTGVSANGASASWTAPNVLGTFDVYAGVDTTINTDQDPNAQGHFKVKVVNQLPTTFGLSADAAKLKPVVATVVSPYKINAGGTVSLYTSAVDPDGDAITWSLLAQPTWASIQGNVLTLTPAATVAPASFKFTVLATDSVGGILFQPVVVQVVAAPDTTPPVFANVPAALTMVANASGGVLDTYATVAAFLAAPTANDAVSGVVKVSHNIISPYTFAVGKTTTVVWTATDAANNTATTTQTVTITNPAPTVAGTAVLTPNVAKVGTMLSVAGVTAADIDGVATLHYIWKKGATVVGGDAPSYAIVAADAHSSISVDIYAVDNGVPALSSGLTSVGTIVANSAPVIVAKAVDFYSHIIVVSPAIARANYTAPTKLISVDMNNDGYADIVTTNPGSSSLGVMLGDGAGGFAASLDSYTSLATDVGVYPFDLDTADFNHDGYADIAVINRDSYSYSINYGDGKGGFVSSAQTNVATDLSYAIAVADFNRDGYAGVATASTAPVAKLQWWNSNGTAFTATATGSFVLTGGGFGGMLSADVNNDGYADMVIANTNANQVSILLNDTLGGFAAAVNVAAGGNSPVAVATADINGDGFADIAVVNSASNTVQLLLNNGAGVFTAGINIVVGNSPRDVALADLNGDSYTDMMVVNTKDNSVTTWYGDGVGGFPVQYTMATGQFPTGITVADFNGDGKADFAVTNFSDNTVGTYLNTGEKAWGGWRVAQGSSVALALAANDIDADTLTYSPYTSPQHGSLVGMVYTPYNNTNGPDAFMMQVSDVYGGVDVVHVSVDSYANGSLFASVSRSLLLVGNTLDVYAYATFNNGVKMAATFALSPVALTPYASVLSSTATQDAYATFSTTTPGIYNITVQSVTTGTSAQLSAEYVTATQDADADGIPDIKEALFGLNRFSSDSNGNGISDGMEDADGDGFNNANELAAGTDPLLKTSVPLGTAITGATTVNITVPTTWTLANSPYLVTVNTVFTASLTIEAGVVIKVGKSGASVPTLGLSLNAGGVFNGSQALPITMTSINDNSIAGVTGTKAPASGDYMGLGLYSASTVNFLHVLYADIGMNVYGAGIKVSDVYVQDAAGWGIMVSDVASASASAPAFNNIELVNVGSGVMIQSNDLAPVGTALSPTFAGNNVMRGFTNATSIGIDTLNGLNPVVLNISGFDIDGASVGIRIASGVAANIHHNTIRNATGTNAANVNNANVYINTTGVVDLYSNQILNGASKGVYIAASGVGTVVQNNLIRGNLDSGVVLASTGNPLLRNNLIVENEDSTFGGAGIAVSSGTAQIVSNTVADNKATATLTAGMHVNAVATVAIRDNIFSNNFNGGGAGTDMVVLGTTTINTYNLSSDGSATGTFSLPNGLPKFQDGWYLGVTSAAIDANPNASTLDVVANPYAQAAVTDTANLDLGFHHVTAARAVSAAKTVVGLPVVQVVGLVGGQSVVGIKPIDANGLSLTAAAKVTAAFANPVNTGESLGAIHDQGNGSYTIVVNHGATTGSNTVNITVNGVLLTNTATVSW